MKHSAFIYLFRKSDLNLYALVSREGRLGVPGGKGEAEDADAWAIICREFAEETCTVDGDSVPLEDIIARDEVSYIEFCEQGLRTCTMFYAFLDDDSAKKLSLGRLADPSEDRSLWADVAGEEGQMLPRWHIHDNYQDIKRRCRGQHKLPAWAPSRRARFGRHARAA